MGMILQLFLSPQLWVKSCLLCNSLLVYCAIVSDNVDVNNEMIAKEVEAKYRGLF